jgi:iron only hydrogenase large subunit-like protein
MACVSGCIGGAGNLTHGEKNKAAKLLCRLFLSKRLPPCSWYIYESTI